MNKKLYPYSLIKILFASFNVSRIPSMPDTIDVPITAQIKIASEAEQPERLQINLRVKSEENSPLSISVEVIGLFSYLNEQARTDGQLKADFISSRAIHILWTFASQGVSIITGQMGMNNLQLNIPSDFDLANIEKDLITEEK